MAGMSFDFRNIVGSEKCAVSSPRIVSLEIGDESPGIASESVFQGIFPNDHVCRHDVKNGNLIRGCDKQSDKIFLIHSQSSLSTSTCDDRPSDKIKSTNDSDIDLDLLDLLNSANLESCAGNFNSKKTASSDKMKIISNGEVCGDLSDLLSSIANDISEEDVDGSTLEYYQRKNTGDCGNGLLDFEIVKNECAGFLSSNNSSLKAEGNLSDLLSSINIDDSDVTEMRSFNSRNMCNSKAANKSKIENELPVADLSDLLSSLDLGDSNDNKVDICDHRNMKVLQTEDESCLADLLSSIDIDNSNKPESDVLNSNHICNRDNVRKMKVLQTNDETCLADLLSSIDVYKTNKPVSTVLNGEPLSLGISNLHLKDTNGISDSLGDFTFDIESSSSSSNSCASSYSENKNNSPKDSLTENNLLADKVLKSESGYSSYDSTDKGFSFFDYSLDNQFSFNTLLTNKSDATIAVKHSDGEDVRNTSEEMSMSDLLTIVSPEFKKPVLAAFNKAEKCKGSMNKNGPSMQDLIDCLNNDSHVVSNNSVDYDDRQMSYDCVDGRISKNVQVSMETVDVLSEKDDVLICKKDFIDDDDKIFNDDEQITFIDLRECIKSADHQYTHSSPIKQYAKVEDTSSESFSPNKVLFYCDNKSLSDSSQNKSNPFEFDDVVPRKKSRVNTKQTLFSKSLACKPKKDHSLLQKVANIKNELLNNIIHRPVFIDCDLPQPIVESVLQSDRCILSKSGRRYFGIDAPCELQ